MRKTASIGLLPGIKSGFFDKKNPNTRINKGYVRPWLWLDAKNGLITTISIVLNDRRSLWLDAKNGLITTEISPYNP
ncbi:MAG: hypothetical protein PHU65_07545, partial [Actinomycetota bacterium]|nr:hypothetical protein [Actinomycetota bacterium]